MKKKEESVKRAVTAVACFTNPLTVDSKRLVMPESEASATSDVKMLTVKTSSPRKEAAIFGHQI